MKFFKETTWKQIIIPENELNYFNICGQTKKIEAKCKRYHDRIIFYLQYLGFRDPLWSFEAIIHLLVDQSIEKLNHYWV